MNRRTRTTIVAGCLLVLGPGRVYGAQLSQVQEIRIGDEDGVTRLHVGGPESATEGILLIHDWFGVTDMTLQAVEHLASQGYRVAALDLYDGQSASDHDRAGELMQGLDADRNREISRVALEHLEPERRSIGIVAFSMGGAHALRLATQEPDKVAATAIVYGGGLEEIGIQALEALQAPVLVVTGSADGWALQSALALREQMESASRGLELYIYPGAGHGFAQPLWAQGANLDTTAVRISWMLIEDYLSRNLKHASP